MPEKMRGFFPLGWGEVKFKAHPVLPKRGLNSRVLLLLKTHGFLFLYFTLRKVCAADCSMEGGDKEGKYPFLNCALW